MFDLICVVLIATLKTNVAVYYHDFYLVPSIELPDFILTADASDDVTVDLDCCARCCVGSMTCFQSNSPFMYESNFLPVEQNVATLP